MISLIANSAVADNYPSRIIFKGAEIKLDASSQMVNGKIMVPVISVAKDLGFVAKCDSNKSEVVNSEKEPIREIVASLPEAKATLYAVKSDGYFKNFKLIANGSGGYFPYWTSVSNPSYAPKLFYNDINGDGRKELIIVLTRDYGTGFLDQEVHVFHKIQSNIGEVYQEVLVDNPKAIILKNVKTKLTPHEAVVIIGDKKNVINVEKLKIKPENLFTDVYFGNVISFDVVNNQLKAFLGAQISPAGFIGKIEITYVFKDKMYQGKKIRFIP